ncbi:hypothetical protein QE177_01605 [Arsenophonus sp. aPb]|uniref:hypothetical protein n=1 Tax=Arsenophonus sp. aPb TaxID=3041619 RepID=UPI002468C460|nr:hypothetical protein [Arsenophonus sp. aPb]WGL98630.1 hypothetical protein QE177_01605 [Arsenophonus sp. aPb]
MTSHSELPATLQPYVADFRKKEQAYKQAGQVLAEKENTIKQIKNRKAETEKTLKANNAQWRQLFHQNKGEMTKPMKALRTECVLAKETLEEFDKLIAATEKDITPYQHQLGIAAGQLIDARSELLTHYADYLFQHFMREHGQTLNSVMRFYYYALNVNETRKAGLSCVYEGVNDKQVMFNNFTHKLMTHWQTDLSGDDIKALPLEINFQLDDNVYLDRQYQPTPWETKKAHLSKKA